MIERRERYCGWEIRERLGISVTTIWYDGARWYIRLDRHWLRPNNLLEFAVGWFRLCLYRPRRRKA